MVTALLGIGSNISPEKNLKSAAKKIRHCYLDAHFSHVYRSPAIGMDGADFLNCCCLLNTTTNQHDLITWFKNLEDQHGRDRTHGSWKPRTLDLDLLIYNDQLLDGDIYRYLHIYIPASELIDLAPPQQLAHTTVTRTSLSL
ncbi:MAG: 2-amino-4-hydroxy-6-hydroxymethyldihydropteridine diphosphokinase [Mariprofundaceae bacterium]